MRIAVLSDIHSNVQALLQAFSIIDEGRIDEIYCLGDIVGYGGNPNECVELIRRRASKSVLGNHDLAAVDTSHARYFTSPGKIAAAWTHDVLSQDNRKYLASLPYVVKTSQITLVHASPAMPDDWNYITSLEDAASQFDHFTTPLCFIGHTHVPFICGEDLKTFRLKKGLRTLINVGSIGQPRDGDARLSFGLLDTTTWTYENIRAEYDVRSAAQTILHRGLPPVLANRLYNGV